MIFDRKKMEFRMKETKKNSYCRYCQSLDVLSFSKREKFIVGYLLLVITLIAISFVLFLLNKNGYAVPLFLFSSVDTALSIGIALFLGVFVSGILLFILLRKKVFYMFEDKNQQTHLDNKVPIQYGKKYYWERGYGKENDNIEDFEIPGPILCLERVWGKTTGFVYFHFDRPSMHWEIKVTVVNKITFFDLHDKISGEMYRARPLEVLDLIKTSSEGLSLLLRLADAEEYKKENEELKERLLSDIHKLEVFHKEKSIQRNMLGAFLLKLRAQAADWPNNSEYAKSAREEIDKFLADVPEDVRRGWETILEVFPEKTGKEINFLSSLSLKEIENDLAYEEAVDQTTEEGLANCPNSGKEAEDSH